MAECGGADHVAGRRCARTYGPRDARTRWMPPTDGGAAALVEDQADAAAPGGGDREPAGVRPRIRSPSQWSGMPRDSDGGSRFKT